MEPEKKESDNKSSYSGSKPQAEAPDYDNF